MNHRSVAASHSILPARVITQNAVNDFFNLKDDSPFASIQKETIRFSGFGWSHEIEDSVHLSVFFAAVSRAETNENILAILMSSCECDNSVTFKRH